MVIAGIDLETTGLDLDKSDIVEIAVKVYDTKRKRTISNYSCLMWSARHSDHFWLDAQKFHGIEKDLCREMGVEVGNVLNGLSHLFQAYPIDFFLSHNGINFDKPILERVFKLYGYKFPETPWIDTRVDVEYPKEMKSMSLNHLLADHQLFNKEPHEALPDVSAMIDLFMKYESQHEVIVERAKTPQITVVATVPFEKNYLLNERRFRWDKKLKMWTKNIRQYDMAKEEAYIGYQLQVLEHYGT